MLARLEKLELLDDSNEWMRFREIRNDLAHEYPSQNEEKTAGLNKVHQSTPKLMDVYKKMKKYITHRLDAHDSWGISNPGGHGIKPDSTWYSDGYGMNPDKTTRSLLGKKPRT